MRTKRPRLDLLWYSARMKNVFIVSHAQAEHHVQDKVGGWFDSELTPLGRTQANMIANQLADIISTDRPRLISSDLVRATDTAKAISTKLKCNLITTPDLREISYGDAEGRPNEWLTLNWIGTPEDNRLDHRNVRGGETRREFATRVYRAMDNVIASDAADNIIVAHGFTLTFLIARWIGLSLEDAGRVNFQSSAGAITHLVEDGFFGSRTVRSLSNITHLNG